MQALEERFDRARFILKQKIPSTSKTHFLGCCRAVHERCSHGLETREMVRVYMAKKARQRCSEAWLLSEIVDPDLGKL
jgi:hypothetical protein